MDGKLLDLALDAPRKRRPALERYGLALALAGLTLLIRGTLPAGPGTSIYQLPLAAVLLSGWFGGRGPGLLASPTADGGVRCVSVSGVPSFDETGRFVGYRGVGRDITEPLRA